MNQLPTLINIVWTGPFPFEKIPEFVGSTDFGIYQIYGPHPDSGIDCLLYIGRALGGSFGWRVPQHRSRFENDEKIRIHLGRITGETTPSNTLWNKQIDDAEKLLIFAHMPPLNRRVGLGDSEHELENVHICNWENRADLLPEVSGFRWTSNYKMDSLKPYCSMSGNEGQAPLGSTQPGEK